MVDAGCGSGILTLSARALGFQSIRGFDNDPDAIQVCHDLLRYNPAFSPIDFSVDDLISGLPEKSIDFLMANCVPPKRGDPMNFEIPFLDLKKSLQKSCSFLFPLTKPLKKDRNPLKKP